MHPLFPRSSNANTFARSRGAFFPLCSANASAFSSSRVSRMSSTLRSPRASKRSSTKSKRANATGKKCEKCGQGELLERISRHGFFLGCSRYPDCDFIQDLSPELPEQAGGEAKVEICDNCCKEMAIKRGRF